MKIIGVKSTMALALAVGIAGSLSASLMWAEADFTLSTSQKITELDTKPGPAFTTIDGKVGVVKMSVEIS